MKIITVGTNMFETTKTATNTYRNEIQRLKTELQNSFLSDLAYDMDDLKEKFPNLDVIYITGTTPEWNDGEECTHYSEIYIDASSKYSGLGDLYERMYECYDLNDQAELDECVPKDLHHVNKKLSKDELEEINEILCAAQLEKNLETVFDTNWMIFIDFRNGNTEVTKEDYECGY